MSEKNGNLGEHAICGRKKKVGKFLFRILKLLLVVGLVVMTACLYDDREHFRIERDYLFVLRMLELDEGEEFELLPGKGGFRTYINRNGSYACIFLDDGTTVTMSDLGNGRFAGYSSSADCFYVAKPVNGDYVFRRHGASTLPTEKFKCEVKEER